MCICDVLLHLFCFSIFKPSFIHECIIYVIDAYVSFCILNTILNFCNIAVNTSISVVNRDVIGSRYMYGIQEDHANSSEHIW